MYSIKKRKIDVGQSRKTKETLLQLELEIMLVELSLLFNCLDYRAWLAKSPLERSVGVCEL